MIADVRALGRKGVQWIWSWAIIAWFGALDLVAASYCSTQVDYWSADPGTELELAPHHVVGKIRGRELSFQSPRTGRFMVSYADIERGIQERCPDPLFRTCLDAETANLEAEALRDSLSAKRRATIFLIAFVTLVIFEAVPNINFGLLT